VEGLILVKAKAVQGADLVSVSVGFGLPGGPVPVLAVCGVAGVEPATVMLDFQYLRVVKLH